MGRPQKQVGHILVLEDNIPNSLCGMMSISVIDALAIHSRFHHTWLDDDFLETIKLKTSSGCICGVGLMEEDGKIFMDKGWLEFVRAHDPETRYFMVFKKLDTRSLKVVVFNYNFASR
jgi:hypothetical protein